MSAKIKIMPAELASQIAAGEVVERPASVVKELVENSLDAGATSVEIEVSLKRRRIRVKDDGRGVPPGEIELALSRHGTSKIFCSDDIFGIGTYGFRGEALPSIASVSRLTFTSCRNGQKAGRLIVVEGGKTVDVKDAPPLTGTETLVENLFYNTPARKKFIRSDSTEMTHITARVIQAALSASQVRFTFIRDKKRVLELSPAKDLLERVRQIFGAEYAENLVEIGHEGFNIKVTGLVGKPDFNRASSMDQYFFVNKRPVKDAVIRMATARAFEGLLPKGRKAVIFLNISVPVETVDVNVHPAKAEVRFARSDVVAGAIISAIHKALGRFARQESGGPKAFSQERGVFTAGPSMESGESAPAAAGERSFARTFELWRPPDKPDKMGFSGARETELQPGLSSAHGRLADGAVPIGQLFKTFIVFEEDGRMVVMDQHTVHERILYERLMKRFNNRAIERQALLTPETFDTDPKSAQMLEDHITTLGDLGWGLEPFGKNSFLIREVPSLLVGKDYCRIVGDIVSAIGENRDARFNEMIAGCISSMACRAAVKSGDALSLKEIAAMADELKKVELPYTCPHGRPIAYALSREELNRYFGR
ncbi:MAG: DNA mismatch repair endonuclease MutL [Nitrospinota bacterium]